MNVILCVLWWLSLHALNGSDRDHERDIVCALVVEPARLDRERL